MGTCAFENSLCPDGRDCSHCQQNADLSPVERNAIIAAERAEISRLRAESEAAKREVERLTRNVELGIERLQHVTAERDAATQRASQARDAALEEAAGIAEREAEGAESLTLGASEEQAFRLRCEAERAREIAAAIRAAARETR